ncbi:hypothetical protein ACFW4X_06670 [Streptomyces smyrnaeus]|uniref:hypothetical protein n=1 Tax=Streptomyces smyrnaeus TaxID=1387713 RepID=UPI00369E1E25
MPNFRFRAVSRSGAAAPALLGTAAVLLGVGGLTACSTSDSSLYAGAGEASSTASPTFSAEESASPAKVSLSVRHGLTALGTAEDAVPRGTAYHLLRDDEGTPEWEIKVAAESGAEWAVTVSDDGTEVTDKHEDKTPDDSAGKFDTFRVPIAKAVQRAADRHPDQELHAVASSKNAKGEDMWKVTLTSGTLAEAPRTHTLVDTRTGKVSRVKERK